MCLLVLILYSGGVLHESRYLRLSHSKVLNIRIIGKRNALVLECREAIIKIEKLFVHTRNVQLITLKISFFVRYCRIVLRGLLF